MSVEFDPEGEAATAALVGAVGGAGTTRLAVEVGAALARDGRRVAVFDAAFGTAGLARHVEGRLDAGASDLLTSEDPRPAAAMSEIPVEGDGELLACPARGPFGALARAKSREAARRFEAAIGEAGAAFDHALVDTPPPASNPAVAAVTAADRVGIVAPATDRGTDGVQRVRDRLADVGASADLVVANRAGEPPRVADLAVPESAVTTAAGAPVVDARNGAFPAAVGDLAGELFGVELDAEFGSGGLVDRAVPGR